MKNLLNNIIKKSQKTATKLDPKKADVKARKCPSCSAPRPADTDIRVCDFCGYRFLSEEVEISIENEKSEK